MAFVISRSTELPIACVAVVAKRVLRHLDLVLVVVVAWQCFCAVCEAIFSQLRSSSGSVHS